ncbi:hypothetical protein BDN72DRAFT_858451 [Pluteus cervinus]|uniref:Uncharacterized protein n=1 Tax=Pluteus cervinus TaxID=181527 RepID=A0ACD3AS96_9AGAR|nr:hypothetical protein BDN72DRAFT_858451 [Pluteus cervinus]
MSSGGPAAGHVPDAENVGAPAEPALDFSRELQGLKAEKWALKGKYALMTFKYHEIKVIIDDTMAFPLQIEALDGVTRLARWLLRVPEAELHIWRGSDADWPQFEGIDVKLIYQSDRRGKTKDKDLEKELQEKVFPMPQAHEGDRLVAQNPTMPLNTTLGQRKLAQLLGKYNSLPKPQIFFLFVDNSMLMASYQMPSSSKQLNSK